ncbi:MAG: WecB/TagA/CpsF family glycosyltransferase [Fimbriimonadaceae bacterium]|nr:MAG: WecB/TagA/CpsF family glycosyltransferase [Fimbriimonadaceae bacterium]
MSPNQPVLRDLPSGEVMGTRVNAVTMEEASERVLELAARPESHYVVAAATHAIGVGAEDPSFCEALRGASLLVPDGLPVALSLRLQGFPDQPRVAGPDLMLEVCRLAAQRGVPIGLFGGHESSSPKLEQNLKMWFPALQIAYSFSPPFRPLSEEEWAVERAKILGSGVRLLFVGLGCPKQEKWMAAHSPELPLVLLGVGAAFDFHAGVVKRAPKWMRRVGLEWLHRLLSNPRRLFARYLRYNSLFLWHLLKLRFSSSARVRRS